jgi:hypothetical protein
MSILSVLRRHGSTIMMVGGDMRCGRAAAGGRVRYYDGLRRSHWGIVLVHGED